jgi:hypothetical protein
MKPIARLFPFLFVAALAQACDTQKASGPRAALDRSATVSAGESQLGDLSTAPLVVHIVAPQATDPAIDQALDNHYAWLDTTARSNHQLLVFMPGATGKPKQYQLVQAMGARLGYHVIGLMYPNSVRLVTVCHDPACWENAHLEILDGIDRTTVVNVNVANSVINRLTKILQFLAAQYPDEEWSRYLEDGQPKWSRIAISGHSQGGGEAALIAKLKLVARVVMFSAPVDGAPGSQAMPWLSTHRTPATRYYGLAHNREAVNLPAIQANWDAIGLTTFGAAVRPEASEPPYDFTHMLITDVQPQGGFVGNNAHNSTAADPLTPLGPDGTPLLRDAWRYMLTARGDEGRDMDLP